MDFLELARERFSVRKFSTKTIEPERIAQILAAANLAPTAHNLQPQKIYVLASSGAIQKIREITPMTYKAPLVFLVCYDRNISWKNTEDQCYED